MSAYLNHIKFIGSSKSFITDIHFLNMTYRQPDKDGKTIKYKNQENEGGNTNKLTLYIHYTNMSCFKMVKNIFCFETF